MIKSLRGRFYSAFYFSNLRKLTVILSFLFAFNSESFAATILANLGSSGSDLAPLTTLISQNSVLFTEAARNSLDINAHTLGARSIGNRSTELQMGSLIDDAKLKLAERKLLENTELRALYNNLKDKDPDQAQLLLSNLGSIISGNYPDTVPGTEAHMNLIKDAFAKSGLENSDEELSRQIGDINFPIASNFSPVDEFNRVSNKEDNPLYANLDDNLREYSSDFVGPPNLYGSYTEDLTNLGNSEYQEALADTAPSQSTAGQSVAALSGISRIPAGTPTGSGPIHEGSTNEQPVIQNNITTPAHDSPSPLQSTSTPNASASSNTKTPPQTPSPVSSGPSQAQATAPKASTPAKTDEAAKPSQVSAASKGDNAPNIEAMGPPKPVETGMNFSGLKTDLVDTNLRGPGGRNLSDEIAALRTTPVDQPTPNNSFGLEAPTATGSIFASTNLIPDPGIGGDINFMQEDPSPGSLGHDVAFDQGPIFNTMPKPIAPTIPTPPQAPAPIASSVAGTDTEIPEIFSECRSDWQKLNATQSGALKNIVQAWNSAENRKKIPTVAEFKNFILANHSKNPGAQNFEIAKLIRQTLGHKNPACGLISSQISAPLPEGSCYVFGQNSTNPEEKKAKLKRDLIVSSIFGSALDLYSQKFQEQIKGKDSGEFSAALEFISPLEDKKSNETRFLLEQITSCAGKDTLGYNVFALEQVLRSAAVKCGSPEAYAMKKDKFGTKSFLELPAHERRQALNGLTNKQDWVRINKMELYRGLGRNSRNGEFTPSLRDPVTKNVLTTPFWLRDMLGAMFGNGPENETPEELCSKIKARYNVALALLSHPKSKLGVETVQTPTLARQDNLPTSAPASDVHSSQDSQK